ncbi:MAG: hypothetical protein IT369_11205, partial [Candidatus Latescibacteria bacterium]|nr:hypothetical protein [Candidatus Latescibacterota bacterium]
MTARRAAWLSLALALGLAVLLVLATPVGPWFLGRGLVWLAPHWGWRLQLGQTSGALAGEFSFVDLRASSSGDSLLFTLERGSFSPWQYALTLKNPVLRLRLGPADSTAADTTSLRLSPSSYPRLEITGGTFQLDQPADSLAILVEQLEAHYRATGDTTGALALNLPRWQVAVGGRQQVAGALQAELNIEPARLELVDLQTQVQSGPVQANARGQGSLGLGRTLPAVLQLQTRLETDSLRAQLGLDLQGALSPMDTRLTLLGQLESSPWGPLSLRAQARLDSARATVDSLHLEAAGGLAEGQLSYALAGDSLALQLRLDHLDLSRLSSFKGQVEAQLEAKGNPQAARYAVQLELAARQLNALSGPPLDARLRASLRPDQTLDATLDSRLGQVQVAGTLAFSGQYDLALTGALDPSTLLGYTAAPVQLQGRARPDSLALQLDSPSLPLRDLRLGPAHAELALAGGRQLQALLSLASTQLQARLRADLQESRIDTFTAELAALPLAQLDSSLAGTLQGQLRASGGLNLAALRVDGQLRLQGAGYQGWQAGDLDLGLEYTAQQTRALLSGRGLLATCTLKGGDLLDGQLELSRASFRRGLTDSLVLSGQVQVAGPISRPEQLVASGLLSRLALRQADWGIRNADTLRFAYADTRLRCEPFTLETPAGRLQLAGSAAQDRLDLQGHIEALEVANWAAAATGTGKLDFTLSGTATKPQVQAQVQLDQLQLNGHLLG